MPIITPTTVCGAIVSESPDWLECCYIGAALLFILALRGLGTIETASAGNVWGMMGMAVAVAGAWASDWVCNEGYWIIAVCAAAGSVPGIALAVTVPILQMPQFVGLLNAFGGLASALAAIGLYLDEAAEHGPNGFAQTNEKRPWVNERDAEVVIQTIALYLSLTVGSATFWGSLVACGKLHGTIDGGAKIIPCRGFVTFLLIGSMVACCVLADWRGYGNYGGIGLLMGAFVLAGLWGIVFVIAIGGADMPVVICVLNTGSGFAGVFAGFMLANKLLVITGSFVGCSGAILSVIMCDAMNRSLWAVLFGKFGATAEQAGQGADQEKKVHREATDDDVAQALIKSSSVIIVPGYGMAAGGANQAVAAVTRKLRDMGKKVRFAIHPVAGRMPGHMNTLLAEARVPYDVVLSMDEINEDFQHTDVVLVIGANDICNPSACPELEDYMPGGPIDGMPVLKVWEAKSSFVVKRSMGGGYSGVDNPLFYKDNNMMYLGNAKKKLETLVTVFGDAGSTAPDAVGAMEKGGPKEEAKLEEKLDFSAMPKKCNLGVLKETLAGEMRVAMTPETIPELRQKGYAVLVESGAGLNAGFSDALYTESGAEVLSRSAVIAQAEVVFLIRPAPDDDLPALKGKWVVGWIGRRLKPGAEFLEKAAGAGVNYIDVTNVPRTSIAQKLDCLSSQGKIVGHRAVIEGVHHFGRFMSGEVTASGKYAPCKVMVLGVGVQGLAAMATARLLGAEVRAWDVRPVKDQVESLGGQWIEVDFKEEGAGAGGYAKESSDAFKAAQKQTFHNHCKQVDIIITCAAIPGRDSPVLIEDYMVKDMRPGSVIVDCAAVGGGNCPHFTKKAKESGKEVYVTSGSVDGCSNITIISYLDFSSRMPEQASMMYAQNMRNLLFHVHGDKKLDADAEKTKAEKFIPNLDAALKEHLDLTAADLAEPPKEGEERTKADKDVIHAVMKHVICTHGGQMVKAPPPAAVSAPPGAKPPKTAAAAAAPKGEDSCPSWMAMFITILFCGVLLWITAMVTPTLFVNLIMVFVLSAWVGYLLIGNVTPALHTPLMSVSNAISGQVILGGIFMVSSEDLGSKILAGSAVAVAAINITGGFVVSQRMLNMFKKD